MVFDNQLFADKLLKLSEQRGLDVPALSGATGIPPGRLLSLCDGLTEPTGDEVLILADAFKLDFKFFVSAEAVTPFEQMEILYRRFGNEIQSQDRQAIAELLYLCDTEQYLLGMQGRTPAARFSCSKVGNFYKNHGKDAARALRAHLGLGDSSILGDVFAVARRLGVHVFRRRLGGRNISGLTIRHPNAGPCVLVNFHEDPYRQRFTLAHELGHVFLDAEDDVVVSFTKWNTKDLREVRANTFASHLLVPPRALDALRGRSIADDQFSALAHRLGVNGETLARGMSEAGVIDTKALEHFRQIRLAKMDKGDPELTAELTPSQRDRKSQMLERGLSQFYVELCLDAYTHGWISRGRLAEALLVDEDSLADLVQLYGRRLAHA